MEPLSLSPIREALARRFVGAPDPIRWALVGLASGLHVLVEDIPGVGKTTLARTLAHLAGLDFIRIQFTPDLLPSDIVGMPVWNPVDREFSFRPGPILHQFVLADEINRASPRTQAALLEAMQEGSVTVDGRTLPLPQPFFVMATQNPSPFGGTFALPEAELDRFGLSFSLGYPTREGERSLLRLESEGPEPGPVWSAEDLLAFRHNLAAVKVAAAFEDYLLDLVARTRKHPDLSLGLSPRAALQLLKGCRALALLEGRDYVLPQDLASLWVPMGAHRVFLTSDARLRSKSPRSLLQQILQDTTVPTGL